MRLRTVAIVAATFSFLTTFANAHVVDDDAAARAFAPAAPRAVTRQPPRVKHAVDKRIPDGPDHHVHVLIPPLVVAPPDRTDPWTGRPLENVRTYAPLDTTDPWTGERIALRPAAPVDTTDPWR
jgi:hypothetical protein